MVGCNKNTHTDRIDETFEISLNEYGIVRNPKNNETIFCLNPTNGYEDNHEYRYSNYEISYQDVYEALSEVENGYFSFIGSTRHKELSELHNDYLASHIYSLNMYDGSFDPHLF